MLYSQYPVQGIANPDVQNISVTQEIKQEIFALAEEAKESYNHSMGTSFRTDTFNLLSTESKDFDPTPTIGMKIGRLHNHERIDLINQINTELGKQQIERDKKINQTIDKLSRCEPSKLFDQLNSFNEEIF